MLIFALLNFCFAGISSSQKITKFIITDNLASSVKFGYGKPKPAPPKDHFLIKPERGTQVLCYIDIEQEPQASAPFIYKFSAFKIVNGKDVWVDERVFNGKPTNTYALIAFNFFEEGKYKIVITGKDETQAIAQAELQVAKE